MRSKGAGSELWEVHGIGCLQGQGLSASEVRAGDTNEHQGLSHPVEGWLPGSGRLPLGEMVRAKASGLSFLAALIRTLT